MSRPVGMLSSFFCVLFLFASLGQSIDCYNYKGIVWSNQTQCEGSDACCSAGDKCLPNRLCQSAKSAKNILIRGTCLDHPWSTNCAQICAFEESNVNTGLTDGVFPRVEICDESTGKYCCRDGENGCCDSPLRVYYLDTNGTLLESAPTSTTSSSTAVVTTTSSSNPATTPSSPATTTSGTLASSTSTADPAPSDSESLALKVGLGVGIPLAAVVAALGTWILLRRKKHDKKNNVPEPVTNIPSAYHEPQERYATKAPVYQHRREPSYRDPSPDTRYEMHEMGSGWDDSPRELMGSEVRETRQQR
ncbi:hypothetical protein CLIM01_11906 [Colletotrichum limetticola]|uniref:Mid2 domain-containing protein n=1 Tax=Colletotrichum limetticola TaxID=1209924 RepID=A0ABQ9PFC0_9PEZI|nr:hypothetical protein CLIM01_11906 [Colletotrichum limetticola]